MSDTETKNSGIAGKGWTDKERLVYLFALIDNSGTKFDYNATPRPAGRSVIACQRMVDRLKGTLKTELEALKSGNPIVNEQATPKKVATPRKRKGKLDGDDVNGTPTKRGRKKKVGAEVEAEVEDEDIVKVEMKEEEEDELQTEA